MTEPTTVNVALIVPNTGDLVDLWGAQATNPDFVAIDGFFGGVVTVSLSNAPVTLTAPSAAITPSPGPTQAQNAVINLTGVLTANVQVTLPLPGIQRVANFTTGNFVVTLKAAGTGQIVGIPQGVMTEVFNDGTDVKFVNLGRTGVLEFNAGILAVPAWITACTKLPFLLCDGTVYNYSDYPYLGPRLQGQFGGNGITTFGTPDLSGRVPLQYDFTGTRITTANCGINGQSMGSAGGLDGVVLTVNQIPSHTHNVTDPGHTHAPSVGALINAGGTNLGFYQQGPFGQGVTLNSSFTGITNQNTGGGLVHTNVQPAQVAGIWLVKT